MTGPVEDVGKIKNREEALKEMKMMIEDAKYLGYRLRTDESYLSRYLHCCSWDPKKACERALAFCRLKSENPSFFCGPQTNPDVEFKELIDKTVVKFLPGIKDNEGRPVYVVKIGLVDPSKVDCPTVNRLDDYWIESILDDNEVQEKGICVLMDIKDYSWRLLGWLTPHNVKTSSMKMEIGPVKQTKLHVVNSSKLMNAAIAISYPLLSDRIKENIHFHYSNWPSLHKHINPELLPAEYGGTGPDFDLRAALDKLAQNRDKIKENFDWGYEKSK
ncbi:clavesin-1-like [Ctenocephalides felis]|uniref:clavesin-1-like n=1 Tax=Ctenocephalides felis TaxID=7515 RepID=UPI000E6E2442|nr:clavesin-1-like [Ctenocephalides felis]